MSSLRVANFTDMYLDENLSLTTFIPTDTDALSVINDSEVKMNFTEGRRVYNKGHREAVLFVQTIVIPIVCALGILGNTLNIVAFTRRRVRRSIGTQGEVVYGVLLSLAVSDLLFCACTFPRVFVRTSETVFNSSDPRLFYQLYCTGFVTTFGLISTWLIVFIASLHYVAICHPLRAKWIVKRRYAAIGCFIIYVGCAIGNAPAFLQYQQLDLSSVGHPGWVVIDLGPFSHFTSAGLIFLWCKAVIGLVIPIVLLTAFNTRLIRALQESLRIRRRYSASTRIRTSASNRLTVTLIVIVTVYVLLVCPSELMDLVTYLTGGSVKHPESFMLARTFANLLQVFNFAFNFLLYCSLNVQFRAALSIRCRRRHCSQRRLLANQQLQLYLSARPHYPDPLSAPIFIRTEQFNVTPSPT